MVLLSCAASAAAADRHDPPVPPPDGLCEEAIAAAEQPATMPRTLLLSIARTESGRVDPNTSRVRPWPWTINADGLGSYFPTKSAAVAAVAALQASGVQSIDVGCMQVNLRHHPQAFANLHEAFDPAANARYAVRFLVALHRQSGDWVQATAAYHSQTHELGARYIRRVFGPGAPSLPGLQGRRRLDPVLPPDRSYAAAGVPGERASALFEFAPPQRAVPGLVDSDTGVPGLACPRNRC